MVSSAPYIFALLSDCRWHWHWLNHIKSAPFAVSCGLICWLAHANELHSFRWFHMKLRDSPDCSTVAKSIPNYWNNTIIIYRRQSSTAKSEIEQEWKRLIAAIYRYIAFVLCSRVFISWLLSSWEKRQLLIANTHPSSHSKFSVFCKPNFRKLSTHFVYRGLLCCVSVLCIPHSIVWQKKLPNFSLRHEQKKEKHLFIICLCFRGKFVHRQSAQVHVLLGHDTILSHWS